MTDLRQAPAGLVLGHIALGDVLLEGREQRAKQADMVAEEARLCDASRVEGREGDACAVVQPPVQLTHRQHVAHLCTIREARSTIGRKKNVLVPLASGALHVPNNSSSRHVGFARRSAIPVVSNRGNGMNKREASLHVCLDRDQGQLDVTPTLKSTPLIPNHAQLIALSDRHPRYPTPVPCSCLGNCKVDILTPMGQTACPLSLPG